MMSPFLIIILNSQKNKNTCVKVIQCITFKESLKLMTNGKSPGSDGYTVDFYKFFWEDIGPLL